VPVVFIKILESVHPGLHPNLKTRKEKKTHENARVTMASPSSLYIISNKVAI